MSRTSPAFLFLSLGIPAALAACAALTSCSTEHRLDLSEANAYAIDGDTIKVMSSGERLRLARIDAPELPGHCRVGRKCAPGDPWLAQAKLQQLLSAGMTCTWTRVDVYARPLVTCTMLDLGPAFEQRDVSTILLDGGYAVEYR